MRDLILFIVFLLLAANSFADGNHANASQAEPISFIGIAITFIWTLLIVGGFLFFFRSINGKDILEFRVIRRIARSSWYPAIVQIPTLVFFLFIVYFFFFGPLSYGKNPGSVLAWTLWWPLVPITFILFGRFWCIACPLPVIGDFIQKFVHPAKKPGRILNEYGIWIMDGVFILITLFDRLYGMVDTPWLSGVIFLLIFMGVLIISMSYERRTFCRHICFLGGVSGNYSMLAGVSIEAKDKVVCAACKPKACYFGSGNVEGCPYFNVIPTKVGMRNCTLCANCIKICPKGNIAVRARSIASELWSHTKVSFAESFFAKLMVGIVIIQNLGMLAVWGNLQEAVMQFGLGEKAAITALYFTAIAIPLLLMAVTSTISNKLQAKPLSAVDNFAAFGYAFIPIDVAGHIAHNLFHLLAEGKSVIGAFAGLLAGEVTTNGAIMSASATKGMQFALITIGALGTLYAAYMIAYAREQTTASAIRVVLPHALLLLIIIGINIFLFAMPMAHRGGQ